MTIAMYPVRERIWAPLLSVWFFDVGQGDSALMRGPAGTTMLIDSGPDDAVLSELGAALAPWERRIDMLVMTHPDLDHIGGFESIIERYDVGAVLMSAVPHTTAAYRRLLERIRAYGVPVLFAEAAVDVRIDGMVYIDVLHPFSINDAINTIETNNGGIVAHVSFGASSLLFTGDIDASVEAGLVDHSANMRADILKVAHHGSRYSSLPAFIQAVQPRYAIISVGRSNRYRHPHAETLDLLTERDIAIRRTDIEGTVVVHCTTNACIPMKP